jgi:hypothetical protein
MGEIIPCFFGNFLITRKIGKLLALDEKWSNKESGENDSSVPSVLIRDKDETALLDGAGGFPQRWTCQSSKV